MLKADSKLQPVVSISKKQNFAAKISKLLCPYQVVNTLITVTGKRDFSVLRLSL